MKKETMNRRNKKDVEIGKKMDRETWWKNYQDTIKKHQEIQKKVERGELIAVDTGGKIEYFKPEEISK